MKRSAYQIRTKMNNWLEIDMARRSRSAVWGVVAEMEPKNGAGDDWLAGMGPELESRTARIQSSGDDRCSATLDVQCD